MIVRKDTWHYKVVEDKVRSRSQISLCKYFWLVVWSLTTWTVGIAAFAAIVIAVGLWFVLGLYGGYQFFYLYLYSNYPAEELNGLVAFFTLMIIAGAWAIQSLGRYARRRHVSKEPTEPGLVRSYIKAKKDRVCPLITFEDSDHGQQ